jgi:hypothetical protein
MKILRVLFLITCLAVLANAQKTVLAGTVYDNQGFIVAGAKIFAKDKIGKIYTARPDNKGVYSIELATGVYDLEFQAQGFKRFKVKKYQIVKATENKMFFDVVLNPTNEVMDEKGFF